MDKFLSFFSFLDQVHCESFVMKSDSKKYRSILKFLYASAIVSPMLFVKAEAQNAIDPSVLRSAQGYCLEKGFGILSDEFSSCLADRINNSSAAAPSTAPSLKSKPETQRTSSPVSVPPSGTAAAPAPEPVRAPVAQHSDSAGMEMYPASTLHGNKDPDYNWLGDNIGKRDLNIITIPPGFKAVTTYGSDKNYRRMECNTPCRVGIPVQARWSVTIPSVGNKLFVASKIPEWRAGLLSWHFSPDTIVFRSTEGLESHLQKARADCQAEGNKSGTIKLSNCIATKMSNFSN